MALYGCNGGEGSSEQWENITNEITFDNSFTVIIGEFYRKGREVWFIIRGTFPNNVPESYVIATGVNPKETGYYPLMSTDWATPQVIGCMNINAASKVIGLNGQPDVANKSFVVTGTYIE